MLTDNEKNDRLMLKNKHKKNKIYKKQHKIEK
jgi:hypothetical protein